MAGAGLGVSRGGASAKSRHTQREQQHRDAGVSKHGVYLLVHEGGVNLFPLPEGEISIAKFEPGEGKIQLCVIPGRPKKPYVQTGSALAKNLSAVDFRAPAAVCGGGHVPQRLAIPGSGGGNSRCNEGAASCLESRRPRRVHARIPAFTRNRFRLWRHGDSRMADSLRSLQEEIRERRANGAASFLRSGGNTPQYRHCRCSWTLGAKTSQRSSTRQIHITLPPLSRRMAHRSRSYFCGDALTTVCTGRNTPLQKIAIIARAKPLFGSMVGDVRADLM